MEKPLDVHVEELAARLGEVAWVTRDALRFVQRAIHNIGVDASDNLLRVLLESSVSSLNEHIDELGSIARKCTEIEGALRGCVEED